MCCGGDIPQVLLPPALPHLFLDPSSHHDITQLLHLSGSQVSLPPPPPAECSD